MVYLTAGWRDNDADRLRRLMATDFRYDLVGRDDEVGIDWYLAFLNMVHGAVAELDLEFFEMIVDGSEVGVYLLLRGRQIGKLFGVESRGAVGAIDVMTRLEFSERRVSRQSTITDFSALQAIMKG